MKPCLWISDWGIARELSGFPKLICSFCNPHPHAGDGWHCHPDSIKTWLKLAAPSTSSFLKTAFTSLKISRGSCFGLAILFQVPLGYKEIVKVLIKDVREESRLPRRRTDRYFCTWLRSNDLGVMFYSLDKQVLCPRSYLHINEDY